MKGGYGFRVFGLLSIERTAILELSIRRLKSSAVFRHRLRAYPAFARPRTPVALARPRPGASGGRRRRSNTPVTGSVRSRPRGRTPDAMRRTVRGPRNGRPEACATAPATSVKPTKIIERPARQIGVDQRSFVHVARMTACASSTASFVTSWKTTRETSNIRSSASRFCSSTFWTCQEIASPSRSGSVARIEMVRPLLPRFGDRVAACFSDLPIYLPIVMSKNRRPARTEPSLGGRSRTWP